MVYNDTTNLNGIIQEIERLTDLGTGYISGDATRLKEFTTYVNEGLDDLWFGIYKASGNWQWDDSNQTDLPQATTDLVSGTGKYALPSDALTIQKIAIKASNGLWRDLIPFNKEQLVYNLDEFAKVNNIPMYYRAMGDSIELKPAPNYNSTAGIKIYFDRASVDFLPTDTNKVPGFISPYHGLLAFFAAIFWLKIKQPTSASLPAFMKDYADGKAELINFYASRFKNLKPQVTRQRISYK